MTELLSSRESGFNSDYWTAPTTKIATTILKKRMHAICALRACLKTSAKRRPARTKPSASSSYSKQEERELRYLALCSASNEMERQLRANEESMKQASLLLQNSGEGMMVTDAQGLILTVNPAFSVLSGYTEKELTGLRAYELSP